MRFFWAYASLLFVDLVTKMASLHWLAPLSAGPYPFGGIPIFALGGITCSLNYIVNSGAAWGLFAGHAGLLFMLRLGIIVGLFFFAPRKAPLYLILTGAVGNAIDYCLYGHVIDFIHFTFWGYSFPIFNVADSCITLGILSLFLFPHPKKAESL